MEKMSTTKIEILRMSPNENPEIKKRGYLTEMGK